MVQLDMSQQPRENQHTNFIFILINHVEKETKKVNEKLIDLMGNLSEQILFYKPPILHYQDPYHRLHNQYRFDRKYDSW